MIHAGESRLPTSRFSSVSTPPPPPPPPGTHGTLFEECQKAAEFQQAAERQSLAIQILRNCAANVTYTCETAQEENGQQTDSLSCRTLQNDRVTSNPSKTMEEA